MITIQELLGTSSIAGNRLTINANFLLIENEINEIENTFNLNTVTGALDISSATSGQIKAKSGYFNNIILPCTGTPNITMYGTGASAGNGTFSGSLSAVNITSSGTGSFNVIGITGPASFGATGTFAGTILSIDEIQNGPTGIFTNKNTVSASGAGFPFASLAEGGGGATGTFSMPYILSGQESIIYADCGYVSAAMADTSNATGFFFQVSGASGSSESSISSGYNITIINTSATGGIIGTGITGPSTYYTGFNTSNGQYNTAGITIPAGNPYRSSLNLMWEPRIDQTASTQKGSWVVLSSSMITSF